MELSKRLTAVAGLVTEGASVADIGTDHGYIPIHLIEQNLSPKVIAMDINKGPLERARIHIAGYGMSDRIETRLSDGLAAVKPERSGGDDRCRNGRRSCDSHSGRRKTNRQHIKRLHLNSLSLRYRKYGNIL